MSQQDRVKELKAIRIRLAGLAFGLIVCALIVAWVRDPDAFAIFTGELQVNTTPSGAEIYVDGELRGESPLLISRLTEGRKVVRISHRFHEPLVTDVEITRSQRYELDQVLPAAFGSIRIVSNPTGGGIELNGERLEQTTPFTLSELQAGLHTLTVSSPDHRPDTRAIEVLPGDNGDLLLDLPLVPWGTLTVKTYPADARVTLPDVEDQYRPGMKLERGEYLLKVSKSGFPTVTERVYVSTGENVHKVTLKRRQLPLTVSVTPADADLKVEYRRDGEYRFRTYYGGMKLPEGDITVMARAPGYRTQRRTVRLADDENTIAIALKQFNVEVGSTFRDALASGGQGPLLTVVPAGSYLMGSATDLGARDEHPVHEVVLTQPFAVGVYEVSVEEFSRFSPGWQQDSELPAPADHPATSVKIEDVDAYLDWLSRETGYHYRLPSESEWEYFARAGSRSDYHHGADLAALCDYANIADQSTRKRYAQWQVADCTDGFAKLAPVGSLKPNAFGLYDISGNASEWVADCWTGNYESAPADESPVAGEKNCHRVFRGGSWDSQPEMVRVSYRQSSDRGNDDRGFRVVREL